MFLMTRPKMSREESLARAHAASRRKRLDRMAEELKAHGFGVITPEELAETGGEQLATAA